MYNSNLLGAKINFGLDFCKKVHAKYERDWAVQHIELSYIVESTKKYGDSHTVASSYCTSISQTYSKLLPSILQFKTILIYQLFTHETGTSTRIKQENVFLTTNVS